MVFLRCVFAIFLFYITINTPLLTAASAAKAEPVKRIFWVDSYNAGYGWSDGIHQGILEELRDQEVVFELFRMDTKNCWDTSCLEKAAGAAREAIERFQPDVLIASDDNAQKYLIVPHYLNTSLPVVFCGVNWDASAYGYPAPNVTGMLEVDLVKESVEHMRRFAKGDRVGYIGGDTTSDRKVVDWLNTHFFSGQMKFRCVRNFSSFKQDLREIQEQVDMLFIRSYAGIEGWDNLAAKKIIADTVRIPTSSQNDFMAPYVVFTLATMAEEQGQYAARTALKILAGGNPGEIPIVSNRKARLTVNLDMAKASGIVLPLSVLKVANVIGGRSYDEDIARINLSPQDLKGKRIAWVDSYHKGYAWSDGLEQGIRETLFDRGLELRIIRMNSKRDNTEKLIKTAAERAKIELIEFRPDIIIASDDNAQKYLIVPYFRDSSTPVVFCGVNWDASMYGYPKENVTGMVEVNPVQEMISLLKPFSKGDRIGFLAGDLVTERKIAKINNEKFFNNSMQTYLVKTWDEFKKSFLQAQREVDILIFSNSSGIAGWQGGRAEQFVLENSRIPSVSPNNFMDRLVLCTLAKSAAEQGRYAAVTALRILQGKSPGLIPLVTNREYSLTVNVKLAQKMGVVFPLKVLKKARVIN